MDAPARVIQKVTFFKILFKEYSKSKSLKKKFYFSDKIVQDFGNYLCWLDDIQIS